MPNFEEAYVDACDRIGIPVDHGVLECVNLDDVQNNITINGNTLTRFGKRWGLSELNAFVDAVRTTGLVIPKLELAYHSFDDSCGKLLAELIQIAQVQELNLQGNRLGPGAVEDLVSTCISVDGLKRLNLRSNQVGSEGGIALARYIAATQKLAELDVGCADLDIDAGVAILASCRTNRSLKKLNLDSPCGSSFDEEHSQHVAIMLEQNQNLEELSLAYWNILYSGTEFIANALYRNKTLKSLNLRCNKVGAEGVFALARMLIENSSLEILDLDANRLTDEGAYYLSDVLPLNHTLRELHVCSNQITDEGMSNLAMALKENETLEKLYVWDNDMDQESMALFYNLARERSVPPTLDFDIVVYKSDQSGQYDFAHSTKLNV